MPRLPGDALATPRFRLRTFGTLRLVGSAGDVDVDDSGHQRRRLAFLAVLAASGDDGRTRDQLLGLFWPEVSEARARHSLGQLLYAIRTSLDKDAFIGVNPIRLNADLVDSDVGCFARALARSELEAAVDLYNGKFLDGFYLSAAPEFERWMDAERSRIERTYTDALERLAKNAEDAHDAATAARWRQKLIQTDPLSSRHAIGLIRALVDSGDHAAALRYAERYEAILGQELGTSVGHAVAELVAEVRAREETASVVTRAGALAQRARRAASSLPAPNGAPDDAGHSDAARIEPRPTHRRRMLRPRTMARYGVAAFALVALVAVLSRFRPRVAHAHPPATATSTIGVLPLANLSADARDASLVDGLTEELIGAIARIQGLRVVEGTSSFVFRNSNLDVRRIADSLRVAHILEGSVQRIGQRVRVHVRLVDARDGSTRWSETYDRQLKDIFEVQREIAEAVAEELDLQLRTGGAAPRPREPQNIAAYELYLRGRDPALTRSDSSARLGVEYFQQAIALEPDYAEAYAGLARMYLRLLVGDRIGTSARALETLAENAARRAVALDDSSAEAHAALGEILMSRYDLAGAGRELTRAATMDPVDSRTRRSLATLDYWRQRPGDALVEATRAADNDPLSASALSELARALCANGEARKGLAQLTRVAAVRPPLLRVPLYTGLCYAMSQDWTRAAAAMSRSGEIRGRGFLGFALARARQREQALAVLTGLIDSTRQTNQGAFEVAVVYAGLGDRDRAFEWLNRSIDDLSLSPDIMLPLFDDLRADPRFAHVRRRIGL